MNGRFGNTQLIAYILIIIVAIAGYMQLNNTKNEIMEQARVTEKLNANLAQGVVALRNQVELMGGVAVVPGPTGSVGEQGVTGSSGIRRLRYSW